MENEHKLKGFAYAESVLPAVFESRETIARRILEAASRNVRVPYGFIWSEQPIDGVGFHLSGPSMATS
jgi:hypothetical protein